MRKGSVILAILFALSMVLAACQPAPAATPETIIETVIVEVEGTPQVITATPAPTEEVVEKPELKMAAIFPGVITDADYNTLAYIGLTAVNTELGVETAYSESVAVPDVDRVMREYLDAGFNIIWTHGGQFVNQTVELARQFPDQVFIAEGDAPITDQPANVWMIDRNFHTGYYAIGALAAKSTKVGKIGYIGGQTLPFSYAEVHAIQQALTDIGYEGEFKYVWAGDFNDPTKARQVADAMIGEGVDVIMGSLNLGMFGVFEAVKAQPDKGVLVTAKYADKTSYAPANYISALLYDFKKPLVDIVTQIQGGTTGGYYPLGFDTGVAVQFPLKNVDPAVETEVQALVDQIISGDIEVVKDITPIQ